MTHAGDGEVPVASQLSAATARYAHPPQTEKEQEGYFSYHLGDGDVHWHDIPKPIPWS